ncbi:MAG TPA: tyrosine-type recombinase/integrase [Bryobacteraceae bacterium]|nr:tyrosine-type recombinase/integrase [Blastocatellia bacterium]HXJ42265.1 tyrosine-type recombinase/integrase [Bryobacteraceae bacterium]
MPLRKRGQFWHYRFKLKGQRYAGSTGLPATEAYRKAAQRIEKDKRAEAKERLAQGIARVAMGIDFATAAGEFIAWCKDVEYRQKASTARRIETSFASLVGYFGLTRVPDIGAGEIEGYKTHRVTVNVVKDVTLRHDLHALSLFFQYAEKRRWRKGNPVRDVSMPSDADAVRIHVLTAEEEQKYFEAAFHVVDRAGRRNLYDVAQLMLSQGCRPEDAMGSRKEHFDGTTLQVHSKSRAGKRILYLTPECVKILAARMDSPGPWLFPSERYPGRHITKLSGSHDRACRAAGVSFVLYDLRHTFGTRQATEQKCDPFTLAAIMGHGSLKTVMRYVHPEQSAQKEAMERYAAAMTRRKLKVVGGK